MAEIGPDSLGIGWGVGSKKLEDGKRDGGMAVCIRMEEGYDGQLIGWGWMDRDVGEREPFIKGLVGGVMGVTTHCDD